MSETKTLEKPQPKVPGRKKIKIFAHYEAAELAQMESLYTSTLCEISEEEIVKGRIVSISNKDVTIDVHYKSEGIVSRLEFRDEDEIKVGDEVEVYLENIEDKMGQLILSKRKADVLRIWDNGRAGLHICKWPASHITVNAQRQGPLRSFCLPCAARKGGKGRGSTAAVRKEGTLPVGF